MPDAHLCVPPRAIPPSQRGSILVHPLSPPQPSADGSRVRANSVDRTTQHSLSQHELIDYDERIDHNQGYYRQTSVQLPSAAKPAGNILLMTMRTLAIRLMILALTLASALCPKEASLFADENPTVSHNRIVSTCSSPESSIGFPSHTSGFASHFPQVSSRSHPSDPSACIQPPIQPNLQLIPRKADQGKGGYILLARNLSSDKIATALMNRMVARSQNPNGQLAVPKTLAGNV